ncbi:MAG: heavy metal translocating P-type ATPase, partial [Pseudomonadota bacterium]
MSEATSFEAGCPSGLAPSTRQRRQIDFDAFLQIRQGARHLDLAVRGAKCGGCISKIEKTLIALPGVQAARLNLSNGQLRVSGSDQMQANAVAETLIDLGYGISARGTDGTDKARASEERSLLIAMAVAGFAAANIMLLSVSVWGGAAEMGAQTRRAFHVFSGLIAFPVILFSGQHFFRSAWSALSHRRVNMDVPISLAVWLAFGTSVWETAMGGEHAYFDACVMLLFFLLIGRFLDARLRRRAYAAAHDLAALQNQSVTRLGPGGAEAVRADEIRAGDRILVAPGERAIVDIDLIRGRSDVDESLVTGESLPRSIGPGARLYSGSINLGGALEGVAVSAAGESLLADIANLLEAGEQRRSTYRKISDRAVSLYVPFVHTTALLTFLGWLAAGADLRTATLIAVSTLIITCPCALALAAPVAQVVASSRLFQRGIFLKSGDALERLASVDHIVFDKTGTLTLGNPKWLPDPISSRYLADAARLARASRHPLSAALVEVAGAGPVAAGTEETAGRGLCATIEGEV